VFPPPPPWIFIHGTADRGLIVLFFGLFPLPPDATPLILLTPFINKWKVQKLFQTRRKSSKIFIPIYVDDKGF